MEDDMIKSTNEESIEPAEDTQPLDRRAMLTALAASAAGVAGMLAMPGVAVAATGDPVNSGAWADSNTPAAGLKGRNWNFAPNAGNGVVGHSRMADGVVGYSEGVAKSGVYGLSAAVGVGGAGVTGDGTLMGVHGRTATGVGVHAESLAEAATALKVTGKATFTRSGVASFPKKKTYITITVPGGLSGTPKFLVTMQGSPGDGIYVAYASKNSTTTIKVRLNKKSTKSTTVAWMVLD
jgi:hypothetical protein